MLSAVPVAFIAVPYTAARLVLTSKVVRIGALLLLGALVATRGYRHGEGPLSPKMPVTVTPGKGIGGILHDLTKRFRGVTFLMTRSEVTSLSHLIDVALVNVAALPALEDFLTYFPAGRQKAV